jgi:hypothetical protein
MNELAKRTAESFLNGKAPLLSALEYPTWNYIIQTFDYTRSYEQGLAFATKLFEELEKQEKQIPREKLEKHLQLIYHFVFKNLDKLDRWGDYLALWETVRENVKIYISYPKTSRNEEGIAAYITREGSKSIYVHFLWSMRHRKVVIERKVEKKKSGAKLDNLLHEQQGDLTPEEVRERFEWIKNFRMTGLYDFDPPASRQRARRREEKRQAIDIELSGDAT